MDPYKCVHCRARRSRGICEACTRLGVKWRHVETEKLTYGDQRARRYAFVTLDDPANLPANSVGLAMREYWREAGAFARTFIKYRGMPPARQEGPRRV